MNTFWQRTLTGAVLVALIISTVFLGWVAFLALCLLLDVIGLLEFYRMFQVGNDPLRKTSGVILSLCIFLSIALVIAGHYDPGIILFNLPLISLMFMGELSRKTGSFANLSFIFLGIIYITIPFILLFTAAFVTDEKGGYQPEVITGYFFLLWANDTGAYLCGTLFGKHRLAPRISPNKTWEGSAGGALLAIAFAYVDFLFFGLLSLSHWMMIGVIVIVTGTLGDLVKSWMKRSVNIKDSGNILPGHGGIIDRFDSLIGSVPFVLNYLIFCL